jgi:hypothetical protein
MTIPTLPRRPFLAAALAVVPANCVTAGLPREHSAAAFAHDHPERAWRLMGRLRYHRRRHNHAIKEMIGLSHAAAAWPELKDAPQWRAYALDILAGELDHQFYPDGVQKELAAHYHHSVMTYFLQYVEFMRAAGFQPPPVFEARIEAMGDYVAGAVRPDGYLPNNNDSDLDDVRIYLAHLADVFGREDWRYVASNGAAGERPAGEASRFYAYAGQLFSRSGWDARADWSFFDIGPWGISHQHNDRLHLSIVSGGRDFLVDTGRYVYREDDPVRRYVPSAGGHNTLLVDGAGQAPQQPEAAQPMSGAAFVGERVSVAFGAFEDGYEGIASEAVHRRVVAHIHDLGWLIVDEIETDRPREVTAHRHFHPDVAVAVNGASIVSADPGVQNMRIDLLGNVQAHMRIARGEMDPPLGWYSADYNIKQPCSVAICTLRTAGSTRFGWLITTAPNEAPVGSTATFETDAGETRVAVEDHTGRVWVAHFDFTAATRQFRIAFPDGISRTAL